MKKEKIDPVKCEICFNSKTGYLEPGIFPITLSELEHHSDFSSTNKRKFLIQNLKLACEFYWKHNIENILIDGSFATKKPIPNDIDGILCFDTPNDQRLIDIIRSGNIWGNFNTIKDNKFPMWHEYKIEFWIHPGHFADITKQTTILDFFLKGRNNEPRGLLKIVQE